MLGGTLRWMLGLVGALALALPGAALAVGFETPDPATSDQQLDGNPVLPYNNVQRTDTPNDPDYDNAEPDDETANVPASTNIFDERLDLFGFAPNATRLTARYKDGPNNGNGMVSGFNAAGAWKITRGDPGVSVAILDTGINWDNAGLRDKVALNKDELPARPGGDADHDGAVSVDDYATDPKVVAITHGTRPPTGQDLIRAFEDGKDDDGNGYVDDIAGWDFFNDDNDPADTSSYAAAENHGSGRTGEAVERGNDGEGSIGVCPNCQFVPLRVWDTFVSDQNNFFMAVTYATDNGVEVIEGADGGLYHSSFAEKASQYAYEHGVSQVYSGDDLNTGNHNYPANYDHTMLIEGTVADAKGLGMDLPSNSSDPGLRADLVKAAGIAHVGTNIPVQTYFRGANTTQFGGHSSISMEGATGSTNTGKAAGAVALVVSAARQHDPPIDLSADEARELLEQTAEDVLPANTTGSGVPDPSQPGFDTHFGYGRANVGDAAKAAKQGNIPPEASIGSPDWYAPLTGSTAPISGLAKARGKGFSWRLEYGLGLAPTTWKPVNSGSSTGAAVNDFGGVDLGQVRADLAARLDHPDRDDPAGPTFDPTREDPYKGQFTVRLVVDDGDANTKDGVDRKVLTALDDPTLRAGFPKRMGAGGEAPLRYADLDGDNVQEMVLPTEDGKVHAYRPDGSELSGFPVKTETQFSARSHLASPALQNLSPPLEPPRAPVLADLTGDGEPELITAAGERLYAWDSSGKLLPGWPVNPDPGHANCALSEQQKGIKHPKCGFLASPAVGHLEGRDKPLDVVIPGLDGRLRAYRPDGSAVPGFPVRLIDPTETQKMTAESINSPAIGDLNGDGRDDIVAATNEVYGGSGGGGDVSFGGALSNTAGSTSRVYAVKSGGNDSVGGAFFSGWPVKPGGVIQDVLPLIGPGHDPALVKVGGTQKVLVSVTGSTSLSLYDVAGGAPEEIQQNASGSAGALNLFESSAVGDIDGAGPGGVDAVKYQVDLEQAANLLLVGQNVPYSHRIGAYDLSTKATRPGFPVITDDYQFLSSSTIAKVAPGASNQVIAGTGLGLLHAYDGVTGLDTAGFPKVTGGWLFSPAALSDDGRLAGITREGYLFEWKAPDAPACQSEWPSFRHDQQGTGNYDADGTPPAAPDMLSLTPSGGGYRLSFRSPGDDGFCGTATRYVADIDGQAYDLGPPVAGGSTFTKDILVPPHARRITIRAADGPADGRFNLGPPGVIERAVSGSGGPGPGAGAFRPLTPQGTGRKPAKPRLKLALKYRRGHTRGRHRRTCANSSIRVTVGGPDARLVLRANLRLGKRFHADRKPPASKLFKIRRLRKTHLRRGKAEVRLRDGRVVRLQTARVRICARQPGR